MAPALSRYYHKLQFVRCGQATCIQLKDETKIFMSTAPLQTITCSSAEPHIFHKERHKTIEILVTW